MEPSSRTSSLEHLAMVNVTNAPKWHIYPPVAPSIKVGVTSHIPGVEKEGSFYGDMKSPKLETHFLNSANS
jgi:hypothetical protein